MLLSLCALLAGTPAFAADGPSIDEALAQPKKAKWDPKGKSMEIYLQARIQMKKEAWDEATDLYVQSVAKQNGCGKCLNELSDVLIGAKRYDDAAKVGELLAALYPDKIHGWANVHNARMKQRAWTDAIAAGDKLLAVDPDLGWAWTSRNRAYVNDGRTDEALTLLDGAEAAGVAKEDVACNKVLVYTARTELDLAKEQWEVCKDSKDADVKRLAEGWLALTQGDVEKASKSLMRAGASDDIRLALAIGRYDEGKYEQSLNLAHKLVDELDWTPWDAQVALARAQAASGDVDGAQATLKMVVLADGWEDAHKGASMDKVLMKAKGPSWPKLQGELAAALMIRTLHEQGKADEAAAWFEKAKAVHGETESLVTANTPPAAEGEPAKEE
jgi:tetratricopeptide (TPR) repeat protein